MPRGGRRGQSRYGRYTGGPDPLAPPVDLAEALEAIGDDVMAGSSPQHAMREFLRRGGRTQAGLDDLAGQVARRRRELLDRHNLDRTLQQVTELLDTAVLEERKQLARDLDDDARFAELQIQNLPSSTSAAVRELQHYDWRSQTARDAYDQIKDLLGREVLDQRFAGMKRALENADEADRAAASQMLADFNDLLEAHARGDDTTEQFERFMDEHGDHFPERPESVEELIDALAQRAAAAQRMMNSMSTEQRAELMALAEQAFGSPGLSEQLARLDANLQGLRPDAGWEGGESFHGEQGLGLGEGTGVLADLAELDNLSDQLAQSHAGANLADVDLDALRRQIGDDAAVDAQTLAELERALQGSGYLARTDDGNLRLSPKAMRRLGKALMREAAERLSKRGGARDTRLAGAGGEHDGSTRPWEFGDTDPWDVTRTMTNAVLRTVADGNDPAGGVQLRIEDVEVSQTESRTSAAVVLAVDTSFSMAMEGRWVPMKRTALALHHLVSTRFRGDHLKLIEFARYARDTTIEELTGLDPEWDKGTNLQHALLLANRHFRKHPSDQPVLLIVTDGEPTAHLTGDGQAWFDWPPSSQTISATIRELDNVSRFGAQITFFRLGDDPGLAHFIDAMAERVDGHVVSPELDDLGAAVVGSYLGTRATTVD